MCQANVATLESIWLVKAYNQLPKLQTNSESMVISSQKFVVKAKFNFYLNVVIMNMQFW